MIGKWQLRCQICSGASHRQKQHELRNCIHVASAEHAQARLISKPITSMRGLVPHGECLLCSGLLLT